MSEVIQEPIWEKATEEEVWQYVAWHLRQAGIESVLVGGAVVAIYTEGLYQSGDLDLVPDEFKRGDIEEALKKIGFEKLHGRYFGHPHCEHLYVEFPKGPVELGEEYPVTPAEVRVAGKVLQILSPTDCVKDRLAGYIHWKTRDLFEQAVLVCRRQAEKIDWKNIEKWCEGEGSREAFEELRRALDEEGGAV